MLKRNLKGLIRAQAVILTGILLTSCANSTHTIDRAKIPDAPVNFGKPVDLPAIKVGKSVRTFALENRAAAIAANRRLQADAEFYQAVQDNFGPQTAMGLLQ